MHSTCSIMVFPGGAYTTCMYISTTIQTSWNKASIWILHLIQPWENKKKIDSQLVRVHIHKLSSCFSSCVQNLCNATLGTQARSSQEYWLCLPLQEWAVPPEPSVVSETQPVFRPVKEAHMSTDSACTAGMGTQTYALHNTTLPESPLKVSEIQLTHNYAHKYMYSHKPTQPLSSCTYSVDKQSQPFS